MNDVRTLLVTTPIMEKYNGKIIPAYMDSLRNNPHLGIYLIASILRQCFSVTILDLVAKENWNKDTVLKACEGVDVVGISSNSMNWATARMIAGWIRHDKPDITLIVGGPHPTIFPEDVLRDGLFDFAIRGEAEEVMIPFFKALSRNESKPDIPGIARPGRMSNIQKISTEAYELIPEPAWDLLEFPDSFQAFPVETARGCPSGCGFCSIPFRKSWRPRSPERIIKSFEYARPYVEKTRTQKIIFTDDCTTPSSDRLMRLGRLLDNLSWSPKFTMDGRIIDIVQHPDLLMTLNPYLDGVLLGAECGYDEGLRRIGKPINTASILKSSKILSSYGNPKRFIYSFIIGLPWETVDQCRRTIQFAENLVLSYGFTVYIQWHTMAPGSRFWYQSENSETICSNFGYHSDLNWWHNNNKLSLKDVTELCESVLSLIRLNISLFGDGRIGFSIPMALRKSFSDWDSINKRVSSE